MEKKIWQNAKELFHSIKTFDERLARSELYK